MKSTSILLFDGVCNLCNGSVQFIIKRDPMGNFKFASLQSEAGKRILKQYNIKSTLGSLVLIENEHGYLKSSAVLRICKHLSGLWKVFTIFWLIPKPLRDFAYDFVANNRYHWFGKQESCLIPTPDVKDRFL